MAMQFNQKEPVVFELDVTGYVCPHPQLYTKKVMEKLHSGDKLELVFDNPSSAESISAMCLNEGNPILDRQKNGSKFIFIIQKG
ncbi:MAG: sulfurtransferase TusA family protein [Deltaproteobacteria bacterium]|jgi:tRNA 2-thiouridine synthesizing protein A|nr:sulfurtransferase TusA family protein [Deltaproteobacteria bacterium]